MITYKVNSDIGIIFSLEDDIANSKYYDFTDDINEAVYYLESTNFKALRLKYIKVSDSQPALRNQILNSTFFHIGIISTFRVLDFNTAQ